MIDEISILYFMTKPSYICSEINWLKMDQKVNVKRKNGQKIGPFAKVRASVFSCSYSLSVYF